MDKDMVGEDEVLPVETIISGIPEDASHLVAIYKDKSGELFVASTHGGRVTEQLLDKATEEILVDEEVS